MDRTWLPLAPLVLPHRSYSSHPSRGRRHQAMDAVKAKGRRATAHRRNARTWTMPQQLQQSVMAGSS